MNPSPSTSTAEAPAGGAAGKAQQWLSRVPASLKKAGTSTVTQFNKLNTTQKIVGGALLAVGVGYLARRKGSSKRSAKSSSQQPAHTLHELLYFINDRIAGYERAVAESQDTQLKGYYKQLVSQSQQFATNLNAFLAREGGEREDGTTFKGKLYRAWMDAKAAVTGSDEKTILGSNIYGEEWAIKAYQDALDDKTLTGAMRLAVERQYNLSQKTYKELQKLEAKQS